MIRYRASQESCFKVEELFYLYVQCDFHHHSFHFAFRRKRHDHGLPKQIPSGSKRFIFFLILPSYLWYKVQLMTSGTPWALIQRLVRFYVFINRLHDAVACTLSKITDDSKLGREWSIEERVRLPLRQTLAVLKNGLRFMVTE